MLAYRLRRWTNIILTLGQRFVFDGLVPIIGVLYECIFFMNVAFFNDFNAMLTFTYCHFCIPNLQA